MAVAARKFEYRRDESRLSHPRVGSSRAILETQAIYSVVVIAIVMLVCICVIHENGFALQDRMNRQKAILESELNSATAINGELNQSLDARVSNKTVDVWAVQHGYVRSADIAAVYVSSMPPMQVARRSSGHPMNIIPE